EPPHALGICKTGMVDAAVAIELDLNGRKLTLDEQVVRELQLEAAAGAGESSTLRDLAFMLDRALTEERTVSLQRAEARALERLLGESSASWAESGSRLARRR